MTAASYLSLARRAPSAAILLSAICFTIVTRAQSVDELVTRGRDRNDSGEHKQALIELNAAIARDPKKAGAYLQRARAKLELKDPAGALDDLDRSLSLDPDNGAVYLFRGQVRYNAENYSGAANDITLAIEHNCQATETPWLVRGEALAELGRDEEAIKDFTHVKDAFGSSDGLVARAASYLNLGRTDEALADLNEYLENSENADALRQRANVQFLRQDYAAAEQDLKRAIEAEPKESRSHALLGVMHFAQGRNQDAVAAFDRAVAEDPADSNYAEILRHLALQRSGTADGNLATSCEGWENFWSRTVARFVSGRLKEGELIELARKTDDALKKSGQLCEAYYYAGMARLKAGDRTAARAMFERSVATKRFAFYELLLARAELAKL